MYLGAICTEVSLCLKYPLKYFMNFFTYIYQFITIAIYCFFSKSTHKLVIDFFPVMLLKSPAIETSLKFLISGITSYLFQNFSCNQTLTLSLIA